ncbi:hypothetical protein [Streptomyces roseoverticillatus]|uniref:hypothetical protein n=1 Tax=Streptomyces roseoverticillatus TaxID=66429 RepID=UPI0012FF3226|nr:hypothetical protein [Streptomyces roseoverticillatus]
MATANEPLPPRQRCALWLLVVVLCAVGAVALPIRLEHKSAEEVFISSEFVLAGCLIALAGIGDLVSWIFHGKITFRVLMLLIGCIIAACASAVLSASFVGKEGSPVIRGTWDYIWAISAFTAASLGGAAAVYRAASR